MAKLTGGEALVLALAAHGVETLFGLPGVQNDYFYNALYDFNTGVNAARPTGGIRLIHTRHEQGAGYMALGYALSTGRAGVYNVVPGPGMLNTSAALATAYACNAPVLCLTGQIRSDQIGRGFGMLHELPDQLALLRGLTKWAERIRHPAQAPALVAEAWRQMATGRPRPVALEVPLDVLAARAEVDPAAPDLPVLSPPVDLEAVEDAARLLVEATHPLIFVGGGAQDAADEVLALAELLQAPVIATYNGRGVVDSRHYLSHTMPAGHRLWPKADVVLGVGTRLLQPLMNWGVDDRLKVIRIDVDPEEMGRIVPPTIGLVGRSRPLLAALLAAVEKMVGTRPSRQEEMAALRAAVEADFARLQPQMAFLAAIREALPDDGFFVEEMTQVGYVARFALPIYRPRTYVSTGYQGTLGWGFATGLGVKAAHPDRAVLTVSGDGGFLFTASELATAVQHRLATVNVVFNDGAYGNVRRMQKTQYGNRIIATDLHNPDFVKLAEAFGAQGLRAETPDELPAAIRQGLATVDRPTVIEVPVGEMPSPWSLSFAPRVRPVSQSSP
ncbi:MAG TPA: thiamine pyrophosphate-dependent enzyme [Caldilineaceae bacterium]|nr:thiamine pyrophosphate-dependent enzyme [Caldilineaceae bacterium]